jgi:hypothetical protein
MRAYTTVARERGVTTIPVDLRDAADVRPNTPLTWVEVAPRLWLVGPQMQHPETAAPIVAAALLAQQSPFPTLMRRLLAGEIPEPVGPGYRRGSYRPLPAPELTEAQMIALGTPLVTPARGRGR